MSYPHLTLLLQMIHAKGGVSRLLGAGLTYSQIAMLTDDATASGLVLQSDGCLALTDEGFKRMRTLEGSSVKRKDGGWICTEDSARIEKISTFDVFLPRRKDFPV